MPVYLDILAGVIRGH